MKTKWMTLALALSFGMAYAQHDHSVQDQSKTQTTAATFKDAKLSTAYTLYLKVKDALVASKADDAKKAAGELQKALKDLKGSKDALTATTKLAGASDLDEQRQLFSAVSNEMATLVKGGQLSAGVLYLEYCPMANGNEGAYWLSNEKQIRNPYFGDKMLKCGSVKETIQ
jgi:tellurite resistance protein